MTQMIAHLLPGANLGINELSASTVNYTKNAAGRWHWQLGHAYVDCLSGLYA